MSDKIKVTFALLGLFFFGGLFSIVAPSCSGGGQQQKTNMEDIRKRVHMSLMEKKYAEVVAGCDSVLLIERNAWAYVYKAAALYYMERYSESTTLLDTALAIDDKSFEAFYWRGNLRKTMGDTAGALSDYNAALLIDPKAVIVLNNRGAIRLKLNMRDSAVADFSRAVAIDSTFAKGWENLGALYADEEEYDTAVNYYNQAIKLEPSALTFQARGLVYYKMNHFDQAIQDFTVSIQYDAKNSVSYLYRAYSYFEIGKHTQMCEDLSIAAELGSEDARKIYQLNYHKN